MANITRIIFFLLLFSCNTSRAGQIIPLYTYYTEPPFAVNIEESASKWLANFLSEKSAGKYDFVARYLPRKRLDYQVHQPGWKGVVAWASPTWFKDPDLTHYSWSRPFLQDADLVVSRKNKPVVLENSHSLDGLVLGGIIGHVYADFEKQLREGKIMREDAHSNFQNLEKLKAGRVDIVFLQASTLPWLEKMQPDLHSWIFVSPKVRSTNHRYIFANKNNKELIVFIDKALTTIQSEPGFKRFFNSKYVVHPGGVIKANQEYCHLLPGFVLTNPSGLSSMPQHKLYVPVSRKY